jgi:hypothetical protein
VQPAVTGQPLNNVIPTYELELVTVTVEVPVLVGVKIKTSSSAEVYNELPHITELVAVTSSIFPHVVLFELV